MKELGQISSSTTAKTAIAVIDPNRHSVQRLGIAQHESDKIAKCVVISNGEGQSSSEDRERRYQRRRRI